MIRPEGSISADLPGKSEEEQRQEELNGLSMTVNH